MRDRGKRPSRGSGVVIVLACVAFDVALHRLFERAFRFEYLDNGLPPSAIVSWGLFPAAAALGFAVLFGFLALAYSRCRAELGRSRWASQRFFAPIALVMFFGVLEVAVVFATAPRSDLLTAVADAVPFLLLGALLGRAARPAAGDDTGREARLAPWHSTLWIALFYVAGRYLLSYPLLRIASGYAERPVGTLAWTVGCGLAMGAFYWLAGSTFSAASPLGRALRVGATLGTFWLMVQLFYALIAAVSVADLVLRGSADVLYLVLGIASFEKLFRGGHALSTGSRDAQERRRVA